jgi:hypothetical protein
MAIRVCWCRICRALMVEMVSAPPRPAVPAEVSPQSERRPLGLLATAQRAQAGG